MREGPEILWKEPKRERRMDKGPTLGAMIGFSWKTSREMLFPFHFNRWFKILVIVWLAAAGVQGCASNFKMPPKTRKISIPSILQASVSRGVFSPGAKKETGGAVRDERISPVPQPPDTLAALFAPPKAGHPGAAWVLAAGGVLLVAGLGLLFVWLSCRFNFVLLDVLVTRSVSIREPFRQNKETGNSYFKWSLAFLAIGFGMIVCAGLATAFLVGLLKGQVGLRILIGVGGGSVTLALFLLMIFTGMVARDFVSPIMYREKISAKEAWGRFLRAETFYVQAIVKYFFVMMGLGLVASVLQSVVSVVIVLVGLVAGGVLAVPGIILIKIIPLIKIPLMVLGAGLGLGLILAAIVVIGMVLLPVSVFFRMFALTYVTRLYPDCDLLDCKARL